MSCVLLFLCWQLAAAAPQAARPLPDGALFLQEVRKRLHTDEMLLSQYTYTEKATVLELDRDGTVKKTHVNLYEVYPSPDEQYTYRKLIAKDGVPLKQMELEKQEREHTKKVEERRRKLEREGTDEKERRLAKETEQRHKEDEIIEDAFRAYDVSLIGRSVTDGQPTIEVLFEPRPGYKARTREASILGKLRGHAWFGENDYELISLDASLIDDISFGLGILAKLNRGAQISFRRHRVNDEIWLPAQAHFTGTGRLLLLKGLRVDVSQEFSDYKKFTVETSIRFSTGSNP
jgi:hypothetical protein